MINIENIVSLDLEFNKIGDKTTKIIQVGLIVGNLNTGEILVKYSKNIKIDEILDPFISKLVGVTQEDIDNGVLLSDVYADIIDLHKEYNCFRNPLTWGGGDSESLRKQLNLDEEKYVFGRRWIDVKTIFISRQLARGEKIQSGLAKSLLKVGLQFQGRKHNAVDDAYNTFLLLKKLLGEFRRDIGVELKNKEEQK